MGIVLVILTPLVLVGLVAMELSKPGGAAKLNGATVPDVEGYAFGEFASAASPLPRGAVARMVASDVTDHVYVVVYEFSSSAMTRHFVNASVLDPVVSSWGEIRRIMSDAPDSTTGVLHLNGCLNISGSCGGPATWVPVGSGSYLIHRQTLVEAIYVDGYSTNATPAEQGSLTKLVASRTLSFAATRGAL